MDVTFDLHGDTYKPYRKPNDKPVYIHTESNHPPNVAKQLPEAVNKRLNEISCNKKAFDDFKGDYEQALSDSGHRSKLTFENKDDHTNVKTKKTNQRKRNIIWYTPPYNSSLKTNLGKEFLKILDKHFPINNPLHKVLNRKKVKMSYSCTQNMQSIIRSHNHKVLSGKKAPTASRCSCRKPNKCPVPGKCATPNVIYRATVSHDQKTAQYIGSTATDFKLRYGNHKKSFNKEAYKNETTLSSYVWENNQNPTPNINWEFLKECQSYAPGQKACDLCLSEKFFIVQNLHRVNNLNKRTDLGNKCPHKKFYTLRNGIT